jgi:hypothetical protein
MVCEEKKYAVFEYLDGLNKGQRFIAKMEITSFYPPAYHEVVRFCDCELAEKITQSAQGFLAEIQDEILINPLNTDNNDK